MPTPTKSNVKTYSIGQQTEEEWNAHKAEVMDAEELRSYNFYIDRFEKAKQQREQIHRYFDDMTFIDDYFSNENAKNTYLRAKLNDSEVRVNTGVTEKKIETIINELLSLNLQHEVRAFDKDDNMMQELGDDMADVVTRTNKIEEDEDLFQEAVIELVTQRAVFVEETVDIRKTRNGKHKQKILKKRLLPGTQVFLGNISIPAYRFHEQPYIFTYERMHWRTAQQIWGDHPKWQQILQGLSNNLDTRTGAYAWRFANLEHDEVEILTYTSLPDNERQVFINGTMMHKPGTEETKIPWGYPAYNMVMVNLKSVSNNFAYGKPLTASAKTLQGLNDEMTRMMIRKWQQAIEPPLGTTTGKTFSRDVWDPGAVSQGLTEKDFSRLIDHQGVTNSEFAMMDFIEKKTQEFIGSSDIQQGMSGKERSTATEVLQLQRNATKQLGIAVLAVARLKRELTKLRIYTVLEELLKPTGKKVDPLTKGVTEAFTGMTVENTKLDNSRTGTKRIQFSNRDLTPEEEQEVFQREEELAKIGINFRFKNINVKTLKNMFLNWYVVVTAQEKDGSAIDKIMFQDQLAQGVAIQQITGQPMDPKTLIDTFERKWKAKDFFQKQAPTQLQPPTEEQQTEQGEVQSEAQNILNKLGTVGATEQGSQLRQGLQGGQTQSPSVNTLATQAA